MIAPANIVKCSSSLKYHQMQNIHSHITCLIEKIVSNNIYFHRMFVCVCVCTIETIPCLQKHKYHPYFWSKKKEIQDAYYLLLHMRGIGKIILKSIFFSFLFTLPRSLPRNEKCIMWLFILLLYEYVMHFLHVNSRRSHLIASTPHLIHIISNLNGWQMAFQFLQ